MKYLFLLFLIVFNLKGVSQTAVSFNYQQKTGVYFRITNILSRSADTTLALVNAGSRDGLFKGSKGGVLTFDNDTIKGRGNEVVADAEVIKLYETYAVVRIIEEHATDPKKMVLPKDNIFLKVYTPKNFYASVFWELAKLNVYLLDESKEYVLDYQKTIRIQSKSDELRYMEKYVTSLRNTLGFVDSTSDFFMKPVTGGRFNNLPFFHILKYGNIYDAYAFIDFVFDFPASYMGKNFKFNETFATWAMNKTPKGKESMPWISDAILNCSKEEFPSFVKDIKYYYERDSLSNYANSLDPLYKARKYDEVLEQLEKYIYLTKLIKTKKAENNFQYYKGSTLNRKGDFTKALEQWNYILTNNPTYSSAYIGRSATFYELKDYKAAVSDLESYMKMNPDYEYTEGYGNAGWYCILAGDLVKAKKYCTKAYELDSFSVAWTVNYGHVFLLQGNTAEAKIYYAKVLDLLKTTEDYTEGPKKDFEIFFMNGWKRKEVGEILEWIEHDYETKYRQKLENNSRYDRAMDLANDNSYTQALDSFLLYVKNEKNIETPRQINIHNAYTWIALCYENLNQRDSCIAYHQRTLKLARELKNITLEINDLTRLSTYSKKYNAGLAKVYENAADALKERKAEENRSNNLYILSIGLNSAGSVPLSYAESSAKAVADSLLKKSGTVFSNTIVKILNNNPTADSIELSLKSIAKKSKPGDTFIFYFNGNAENKKNNFELYCHADTKISSRQLSAWLSQVEATHQCIFLDAPASAFITQYINADYFETPGRDIYLLCPMQLSLEDPNFNHSLFTHELLVGFHDAANSQGIISVKTLDEFMFRKLGRDGFNVQAQSYSLGKDFNIASNATGIDYISTAPKRGGEIINSDDAGEKSPTASNLIRKDYALLFANYSYDEWGSLSNPKKDIDDIAKELRNNYGFEVEVVYNATSDSMNRKLREYIRKQYTNDDQLFIFFAGHGAYDEETKEGFIVCKDAKMNDENKNQYMSYANLREKINSIRCNHVFLCLDVCFGGTFDQRFAKNDRGDENDKLSKAQYIITKREYKTRRFITSGGKKYVPDGQPGHNSPFAKRLLEGFRNTGVSKGYLTYSMLCANMEGLNPDPRYGEFGDNEAGSEFIFDFQPDKNRDANLVQQKSSSIPASGFSETKKK